MMILMNLVLVLISILLMLQIFLSKKSVLLTQGTNPLESGFESLISSAYLSAPFFFLSILFVLFDLELILYFPGVLLSTKTPESLLVWTLINFTVVITLIVEWSFCGLKWHI